MSEQRRLRLDAFNEANGQAFSSHDLDLIAWLGIQHRSIASGLLWDDAELVLARFDELVHAAEHDSAPAATTESARYDSLRAWRDNHDDDDVRAIPDADLGRLATAPIDDEHDLVQVASTLRGPARSAVIEYGWDVLDVLGVEVDPPAPEPAEPTHAATEPQPSAPEPAPEPQVEVPDPSKPFDWVQVTRFAPYDWNAGNAQAVGHVIATTVDGRVQMEWTPAPAPARVTLYRIVSSPDSWPTGAPEMASPVGVTMDIAGSVPMQPRGQITYLAVWAHQGDSVLAASQSQPVLIGKSEVVWPPTSMTVNVTPDKAVAASWTAPAGSRVEAQRFPAGMPVQYDQSRLLQPDAVATGGFLDREAPQGRELVYAAFCVAELPTGGSAISAPVTASITVQPDAEPIQLNVKRSDTTPGAYDLTWMQPKHGRVVLFVTKERPPQGLENEPRTREILESQGLTSEQRITYPADDLGGLHMIHDFVVDRTWVRAHFVAVHWVDDNLVWMGPPVSMVTPRPPEWAKVLERVDAQILTFPWPAGVSIVEAYQSPRGTDVDPADNEPIATLTREEYDQTGGMRVTRTLPSNGCSLHLFGVVYLEGQPIYSTAVTIDYPGITRLRYEMVPMQANQQIATGGAAPAFYRLFATVDDELHEVPIAIVGNDRRLPLEPGDGHLIRETVVSLAAGQRIFVGDLQVGQRRMFVRLFVNRPAAEAGTIAVLDPLVHTLGMWL